MKGSPRFLEEKKVQIETNQEKEERAQANLALIKQLILV